MTGGDVSGSDMPNFSWPVGRDVSAVEDAALAAILAGSDLPAGAAAGLRPVADVLAALRAGPASDELSGLGATQAEFRRRIGRPARPGRSRGRRPARVPSLLSAKAAAIAAIAAIGLGGAEAAAYAGALPGSWQQFAHRIIGAPAPNQADTGTPADPHGAQHAAYRLCTAYLHATAHGSAAQKAAAFRNLVRAAGGVGQVTAFCAAAPQPRPSPPRPYRSVRPDARPTAHPSPRLTGPPAGRPSPRPTAPPAGHPSPHPARSPTGHPSPHHTTRPSPLALASWAQPTAAREWRAAVRRDTTPAGRVTPGDSVRFWL